MDVGASVAKKPKIPKEIEKLVKAFHNRRQFYFIAFLEDGQTKTLSNIVDVISKEESVSFLKKTIDKHYENL